LKYEFKDGEITTLTSFQSPFYLFIKYSNQEICCAACIDIKTYIFFYVRVTVHRNKFLYNKTN